VIRELYCGCVIEDDRVMLRVCPHIRVRFASTELWYPGAVIFTVMSQVGQEHLQVAEGTEIEYHVP